jgi:signal transduction histidine kinase
VNVEGGFAETAGPAGDVNGDGFNDLLVNELGVGNGQGRIMVFYGSAEGLGRQFGWSLTGRGREGSFSAVFGIAVGDIDGDGFDDLMASGEYTDRGLAPKPKQELCWFRGSPSGPQPGPAWRYQADDFGNAFFLGAGRAGDINRDGYGDVYGLAIVPAETGTVCRVIVFHGSASGLNGTPDLTFDLEDPVQPSFPRAVCAGDVNGDGYDDLLVATPSWSGTAKSRGRAQVYHGSARGLNAAPAGTVTYALPTRANVDEAYEQFFGWSIASAGDINGDGFSDVIIGACYADRGDINEGLAFVYHGSPRGLDPKAAWHIESNHPHALLGYGVSGAGDVNGDGFDDVIVGVPNAADGQFNEGAALVFLGAKKGLSRSPHWCVESDNSEQYMGRIVAGLGDVNGDGYGDVLVTAPEFKRDGRRIGRVYVFHGSAQGFSGSFGYRIDKPMLTLIQQTLDRAGAGLRAATTAGLLTAVVILLVAWRRALGKVRAAERETARLLERERLARDLHDELGAGLARLAHLNHHLPELNPEPVSKQVQQALRAAQQVIWAVNPANDTLENLVMFLFSQASDLFAETGIRCLTTAPTLFPDLHVEPEVRKNLLLATNEALANALKHSQATEVSLAVQYTDSNLEITVEDNGSGLPGDPTRRFGNGLKNMRKRMQAIDGHFEIVPGTTGGTRVILCLSIWPRPQTRRR